MQEHETCPTFSGSAKVITWNMPDPVKAEGTETEQSRAFQHLAMELNTREREKSRSISPHLKHLFRSLRHNFRQEALADAQVRRLYDRVQSDGTMELLRNAC